MEAGQRKGERIDDDFRGKVGEGVENPETPNIAFSDRTCDR